MDVLIIPNEIEKDELLVQLWEKLVGPGIKALEVAKSVVESLKPPTDEEMIDLIDSSEEESIIEMREALEEAEKAVETFRGQLESWARETLTVSASADEKATATQALNREKSRLKSNLESMRLHAEQMQLTEAIQFIEELIKLVFPPSVTRSVSSNTNEIREWAKGQGIKVNDRGRIPVAVQTLWENRDVSE